MGSNHFMMLVLIVTSTWVCAAGSPGSEFLDKKEAQVTSLAQAAQQNNGRQCELLASCSAPTNCSRNSCWPLLGDVGRFICQEVKNNSYCRASTGTCQSKYFDFTRSYVRTSPTTDKTAAVTGITICSQRELDAAFKSVCNASSLSRAFFGTVDGTYMHFPGSDQSPEECGKYDPRLRPWYRVSTSVMKTVMVLVDTGVAMGSPLPTPLKGTHLTSTQTIVQELLNTLSEQDHVNVITFDSSKATSLSPAPVRVEYYKTRDSTYHPEFDGLKGNLSSIKVENAGQRPSNVSLGITEALKNYAPGGVPGYNSSLKIIIIFTDGNAATLKDGALAELVGKNVKVFIFKLPQPEDTDRFLTRSPFLSELSSMGGSFNVITSEVVNPLYAIQPYFSFLAQFRTSINGSGDYSIIYEDYEGVVDNIFSITKPVYDAHGKLLGIIGLNIFMDGLGSDTQSVTDALSLRNRGKAFDPSKFILSAANASIQTDNISNEPCGSSASIPSDAGLCAKTDTVSTIQDLTCCDACPKPALSTDSSRVTSKTTKVIIGVAVSIGGLLAAGILFYFVQQRRRRHHNGDQANFVFPGSSELVTEHHVDQAAEGKVIQPASSTHFSSNS